MIILFEKTASRNLGENNESFKLIGVTGSTNFGQISLFVAGLSDLSIAMSSGLITGVVFIGVALMFKITAAPFHMWAPDVYEGAPTIVSTFFAVVPKIAILGFLLLFFFETTVNCTHRISSTSLLRCCRLFSF